MNRYVQAVVRGSRLSGVAYQTLLMLAVHADANGTSYPSVPVLAREVRASVRAVQYGLEQAQNAEELEVQRGTGRGHRSHYTIALEVLEKGAKGASFAPIGKGAKGAKPATIAPFPEAERVQLTAGFPPPIPPYGTGTTAAASGEEDHVPGPTPVVATEQKERPPTPRHTQPAPKPGPPTIPNGTRVGDYIAYLKNHGHANLAALTDQDKAYIHAQTFNVEDFAACMVAIADGTWSDPWIKGRFTIRQVHQHRWPQWIARHSPTPAPAPNGVTGSILRWAENHKRREEDAAHADDRGAVRRALPSPRPGL